MAKELIGYDSYIRRKVEAGLCFLVGFLILCGGMVYIMEFPETPFYLVIFAILVGLVCFGYGIYLRNKLHYEMENEGYSTTPRINVNINPRDEYKGMGKPDIEGMFGRSNIGGGLHFGRRKR